MTNRIRLDVRSFSAPPEVIQALHAAAKARGVSISALIRESLAVNGITPKTRTSPVGNRTRNNYS